MATAKRHDLTAERLRSLLHYEPETGVWTRTATGTSAGGVHKSTGYIRLKVDGVEYLSHILAWFFMTGKWPTHFIDHKDTNKQNNAWRNLRAANNAQNQANVGIMATNKSGFKGVSFHTQTGKWQAHIRVNSRSVHLGYYAAPGLAHAAYVEAASKHRDEFARVM